VNESKLLDYFKTQGKSPEPKSSEYQKWLAMGDVRAFLGDIPSSGLFPTICILDDDFSIHDLWEQRLTAAGFSLSTNACRHFASASELDAWLTANKASTEMAFFLIDYELLEEHENGLNVIERLGIAERSILVTGRFGEADILARATWMGVMVLPKPLVGLVPISVSRVKRCGVQALT
jgi:hypothetical protein